MPTYVYHCEQCDTEFEAVRKFSDAPLTTCPVGHEGVQRVFTPAGIIFKGSGWYIKDSKGSSTPPASSSTPKSEAKGEAKGSDTSAGDSAPKSEPATSSGGEAQASPKSEAAA